MTISELYFKTSPQKEALDPQELDSLMNELPQWEIEGLSVACLVREYKCADFLSAMAFAKQITDLAEQYDHHPELTIRWGMLGVCLLYTSPSPRDKRQSRMPSSA